MRIVLRSFFWLLIVLVAVSLAAVLARHSLAEFIIKRGLTGTGIEQADFQVERLQLDQLVVQDMVVGPPNNPSVTIEALEISYDWRTLWRERRVSQVIIGPGHIQARLDETGAIVIPGLSPSKNSNSESVPFDPVSLPLERVKVRPITIDLETPEGLATANLEGGYEIASGGQFLFKGKTDQAGPNGIVVRDAKVRGMVDLQQDGRADIEMHLDADIETPAYKARNLQVSLIGQGQSWIEMISAGIEAAEGDARIEVRSVEFPFVLDEEGEISQNPIVETVRSLEQWSPQANFDVLSVSGGVGVAVSNHKVTLIAEDIPLRIISSGGDRLEIGGMTRQGERLPLIEFDGDKVSVAVSLTARTDFIDVDTQIFAEQENNLAPLIFSGSVDMPKQKFTLLQGPVQADIDRLFLNYEGVLDRDGIRATGMLDTVLSRVVAEPITANDMQVKEHFDIIYEPTSGRYVANTQAGACVEAKTLTTQMPELDLALSVQGAAICAADEPLFTLYTQGDVHADYHLRIVAKSFDYQHAELTAQGVPPAIDIAGQYDAVTQSLTARGDFAEGNLVVNELLALSRSIGKVDASITGTDMTIDATLDRILIAQAGDEAAMVSPVIGQGFLVSADDQVLFEATVSTLGDVVLGTGSGIHDMATGEGKLDVELAALVFEPDELQPENILPALVGIVRNTTGSMTGIASFGWAPDSNLQSRADLSVQALTFNGPSIAVSQTGDINGRLILKNLLPVTSDGVQNLSVGFVDLNALRLENGDVSFEFPGDDLLKVMSAEFPWFGGTIGAYETSAAMTGEKVVTVLKAYDVDLGQLLGFMKIDGLSGQGIVEGDLPLVVEDNKIRVENGVLAAAGPGVIRFDSAATREAAKTSEQARIAFDILRELKYETLKAEISGPLDGDLAINIIFEGTNDITVQGERIASPVIYRISLEAPLAGLVYQGQLSTDFVLQKQILDEVVRGEVLQEVQE